MSTLEESIAPLNKHIELSDVVYALLSEENRLLREGAREFKGEFIERKRRLIEELEVSAQRLKEINKEGAREGIRLSEVVKTAQNKIMKNFILNKENEILLQQNILKEEKELKEMPVSKLAAGKIYGKQ
jgi:flagellar biosynthesis/type III secretory pathway chaperone